MRKPRVTVLLPYELDVAPGQRFRWEQWLPHLEAEGHEVELLPFSTRGLGDARRAGQWARAALLFAARYLPWLVKVWRAARRSDLVVVHRNAALTGPPVAEALVRALGRPIVYDFDDAIYLPPEAGDNPLRRLARCDWRCSYISARAALVGVGSPVLGDWARPFNGNVVLWPTTVDTEHYALRPEPEEGAVPVVGWTGSQSTTLYIRELLPTLAELQREVTFDLLIVGADLDLAAHGIRGRCVPWSSASEVESLTRIDIGLMPLRDSAWARGKCALKAIQYLAIGTPAVVSDVGVNRDVVQDGECGFVIAPGGDWKAPLRPLLADRALRRRMGVNGRERVVRHYSAAVVGPKVARDLLALLDAARADGADAARQEEGAAAPPRAAGG